MPLPHLTSRSSIEENVRSKERGILLLSFTSIRNEASFRASFEICKLLFVHIHDIQFTYLSLVCMLANLAYVFQVG